MTIPEKKKRPSSDLDDYAVALAWFLVELGIEDEQRREIEARALEQAQNRALYTLAQITREVWDAVDGARAAGEDLATFKTRLSEALEDAWGAAEGWRVALLVEVAVQGAYQRGRWDEATTPERLAKDPLWTYTSALEARTCAFCASLHGTTLPASDGWWLTHWPQIHPACLCSVIGAADGAVVTESPPDAAPDPGFGTPEGWEPNWEDFPPEIAAIARATWSKT